jgi:hypothetical protein
VGFRERILADPVFAAALGNDLGQILAEQHTRVPRIELEGWLPGLSPRAFPRGCLVRAHARDGSRLDRRGPQSRWPLGSRTSAP